MMTLLLAFVGVARAELVEVGVGGTTTNSYLPCYTLYNNTLSQQIYTADEIGMAGTINSIAFYNGGSEKSPLIKIYMVNTSKSAFSSTSDWITASSSDKVFEGTVTFTAGAWTTITLNTPFVYDGSSNFGLIVDANISWSSGLACRVFDGTSNCSIYSYDDNVDFDATSPQNGSYSYNASVKNQLQLDITPGSTPSGEAAELIVHDGTENNGYIPMYGGYFDDYTKSECVFPAGELSAMNGGTINAVTFYVNSVGTSLNGWGSTQQVFLKEVDNATISSFYGTDGATIVYEGALTAPTAAGDELVINFTTPYQYNGGNLLLGVYNTTNAAYQFVYFVGETVNGASGAGSNASSLAGVSFTQRNFLPKTRFSYTTDGGDTPEYESGLHTLASYGIADEAVELIDQLIIERPNGAWMEPYHFQLYNDGDHSLDVLYIDFLHNNGYFSMDEETTEYPFTVPNTGLAGAVDLYVNTNTEWEDTEVINSLLAVNTNERSTHLYEIIAAPYQPYCPDVWEKAYPLGVLTTGQVWNKYASEMWNEQNTNVEYDLHANYDMPDFEENIPDGYDAVIRFTANHDIMLNAYVRDGENGKVALYRSDFAGEDGPMADNYYDGRPFINIPAGEQPPYEAQLGQGTSTSGYLPFYCFYNYSISAQLYRADELAAAGANTAPMTSISYECSATNGNTQNGITIDGQCD